MVRRVAFAGLVLVACIGAGGEATRKAYTEIGIARLLSPTFGYVAAYDVRPGTSWTPHVFVTRNGAAFRDVTPPHLLPNASIHDIAVLGRRAAWLAVNDCVSGKAFVYRTTTGGRQWRAAAVRATTCAAGSRLELSFVDRRAGWLYVVFANGNRSPLEQTTDGGRSWHQIRGSLPMNGDIVFRSRTVGFLGADDFPTQRVVVETRDGGRRWRTLRLPVPQGWERAHVFTGAPTFFGQRGVMRVDARVGRRSIIVVDATADGGRTWHVEALNRSPMPTLSSSYFAQASFVSPTTWWLEVGRRHNELAITTDAGASWRTVVTPTRIGTISAADGTTAWVTTLNGGPLLSTRDGGRTWQRVGLP